MFDPRKALEVTANGTKNIGKTNGKEMVKLGKFMDDVFKDTTIDLKTKELISVAISVHSRCEYCIASHTYNALKVGLTREEIMDAAMVAIAFGGGPALAYSAAVLEQCLTEFEKDFE